MSPRSTTRPLYFWCFASISAFFRWQMSINDAKWTVAPDVLASSITSFLLLTFVRSHARIFSNFSHSSSTAAFRCGNLHGLRHRNKFVNQIVMLQWIAPFLQYGPHDDSAQNSPTRSFVDPLASKYTQVSMWFHSIHDGSPHAYMSCLSCEAKQEPLAFPIPCEHPQASSRFSIVDSGCCFNPWGRTPDPLGWTLVVSIGSFGSNSLVMNVWRPPYSLDTMIQNFTNLESFSCCRTAWCNRWRWATCCSCRCQTACSSTRLSWHCVATVRFICWFDSARQPTSLIPIWILFFRVQRDNFPTSCDTLQCAHVPSCLSSLICIQDSSRCNDVSAHRLWCKTRELEVPTLQLWASRTFLVQCTPLGVMISISSLRSLIRMNLATWGPISLFLHLQVGLAWSTLVLQIQPIAVRLTSMQFVCCASVTTKLIPCRQPTHSSWLWLVFVFRARGHRFSNRLLGSENRLFIWFEHQSPQSQPIEICNKSSHRGIHRSYPLHNMCERHSWLMRFHCQHREHTLCFLLSRWTHEVISRHSRYHMTLPS